MEKWKIGVIVALIVGLCAYGINQQKATIDPGPDTGVTPTPTKPANQNVVAMVGKQAIPWNISKDNWINTPAPITPADIKGKVTVIEFFRVGCPHCQDAAPFMNRLFTQYNPKGVVFIGFQSPGNLKDPMNPEMNWPNLKKELKADPWSLKYPVAYDEESKLFQTTYKGDTWPALLLVDRKGTIAMMETGYEHDPVKAKLKEQKITAKLDSLLK